MGVPVRRFDFLFWLGREMVRNAENVEDMVGRGWPGGQYARGFGGTVEPERSPRAQRIVCGCLGSGSTDTATKRYVWGTYSGAAAHTRPWASTGFRPNDAGFGGLNIDECIQLTTLVPLGAQSVPAGSYYLLQDLL